MKNFTEFLSDMSCEIRNDLNGIEGFSVLMISSGISPEGRSCYNGIIRRNTENLVRLVDDILFAARFRAGGVSLRSSYCKPAFVPLSFQRNGPIRKIFSQ
jgi:signal transduction histidine kinase